MTGKPDGERNSRSIDDISIGSGETLPWADVFLLKPMFAASHEEVGRWFVVHGVFSEYEFTCIRDAADDLAKEKFDTIAAGNELHFRVAISVTGDGVPEAIVMERRD